MKRTLIGLIFGLILSMVLGTSVFAQGMPRSIHVTPQVGGSVLFNVDPGDTYAPPRVTIDTPHGTLEPTQ